MCRDCVDFGHEDQVSLAKTDAFFFPETKQCVCLQGSTVMDDSVDSKFSTSTNVRLAICCLCLLRVEMANT